MKTFNKIFFVTSIFFVAGCSSRSKDCNIQAEMKPINAKKGSGILGNDNLKIDFVTFLVNKDSNLTMMAQNLSVRSFRNGDSILLVKSPKEASAAQAKKKPWCAYYLYDENNKNLGLYYNGYAVTDKRGLAPKGWHIATPNDWHHIWKIAGGEDEKPRYHVLFDPKTFPTYLMLNKLSDQCPDLSQHNQRPIKEFNLTGLTCTAYGAMGVSDNYWKGGDNKQDFRDFGNSCSYWSSKLTGVGINSTSASLMTMFIGSSSAELSSSQICCYQHMVRCVKDDYKMK